MSKSIKALVAVSLFVVVAACGQQEEEVVIIPAPVEPEPAMTKY